MNTLERHVARWLVYWHQVAVQRFRESPLSQGMESADQRLPEVPYSLVADGRVESGIMDALYRRGEGWTLVEFKADDVRSPPDFTALLAEQDYLAQAQRYLAAAERLLGQRPWFVLCLLNYAGGVRVEMELVA